MKKLLTICVLVISTYGICAAQKINVMFHMGAGTFSMKTQKQLQQDVRESVIPWRPVHEFEPYWIYGGSLSFNINPRVGVSAYFEYGSTGGTLHYSDYSGSARFDQLLRYKEWGVGSFLQINRSERWPLFVTGHILLAYTRETVSYSVHLGATEEGLSEQLRSTSFGLRPGVMMRHRLKAFVFQGNMGMEVHFPGELANIDGNGFSLQNGNAVNAQWSGLRATLGVGLTLGKKKAAN